MIVEDLRQKECQMGSYNLVMFLVFNVIEPACLYLPNWGKKWKKGQNKTRHVNFRGVLKETPL